MSTQRVTTTNDWVDIKTSLSLTEGLSYVINHISGEEIYTNHNSVSPTTRVGQPIYQQQDLTVTITSDKFWVRADGPGSTIVITTVAVPTALDEGGAGAEGTGVALSTTRTTEDGVIVTSIKIDMTGLASVATANDAIGLAAGGVAFIGRNVVANNGVIFKTEFSCIETPVGGDNDVNVVTNVSGVLEYSGAAGTTYISNSGDLVIGQTIQNLVPAITANHYYYLSAGAGDTAAAYTAGQYLLKLYGHPVLT